MRLVATLFAALLLFGALPPGPAHAETALATGYVNTTTLNLRKGAGTGYGIVTKLTYGTAVNVYAVAGTWLRIDAPSVGKSGYVSGHYITLDAGSFSGYGLGVTTGSVNIRQAGGTSSAILGTVQKNKGLTVYASDPTTGWYHVRVHANGLEGYISPNYVNIFCFTGPSVGPVSPDSPVSPAPPGYVGGSTGYINASGVNFRTGPSTKYKSQGKLSANTAVTVLGYSGSWTQLTVDATGKSGYVFSRYVSVNTYVPGTPGTPVSPVSPGTPTQGQNAYVNAKRVNFRAGPSTKYKSYGYLYNGEALMVTGSSGAWYQATVLSTGRSGYVHSNYVALYSDPGILSPYGTYPTDPTVPGYPLAPTYSTDPIFPASPAYPTVPGGTNSAPPPIF